MTEPLSSASHDGAERIQAIARWFGALQRDTLGEIDGIYAPQARFQDPFHAVQGLPAIEAIYARMFDNLQSPRFLIEAVVARAGQGFVTWRFVFGYRGREHTVSGASHLVLDAQGLIAEHRDYWDAAQEVYEKVPLLGAVLRRLRRRIAGQA